MKNSQIMQKNKAVIYWLWCILLMMFILFVVGGITRLTYSGLSMTDWKPVTGLLPPLNDVDWKQSFSDYQEFQEFQEFFPQMSLSQYKSIYFWEYLHRILARFLGFVFFVPFIFLWWKKKIPMGYHKKLFLGFILGGFQGVIGWLMVKTGLQENPRISHFALALHFCFALALFSYLFWILLSLKNHRISYKLFFKSLDKVKVFFLLLMIAIVVQIIYGAFTAGLKSGLIFNTYPLMDGNFFVSDLLYYDTFLQNIFLNPVMIQWIHRWLGTFIFIGIIGFWILSKKKETKQNFLGLVLVIGLQFGLGVLTLVYRVPVVLGSLHQLVAIILWSVLVYHLHYFCLDQIKPTIKK